MVKPKISFCEKCGFKHEWGRKYQQGIWISYPKCNPKNNTKEINPKNFYIDQFAQIIKLKSVRGEGILENNHSEVVVNLLKNIDESIFGANTLRHILENWEVITVDLTFDDMLEKIKDLRQNINSDSNLQDNEIKNNVIYVINDDKAFPYTVIRSEIDLVVILLNKDASRFPIHYIHEGLHVHFAQNGETLNNLGIQEPIEEVIIELIIEELVDKIPYLEPFYTSFNESIAQKLLNHSETSNEEKGNVNYLLNKSSEYFNPYYRMKKAFKVFLDENNISFETIKSLVETGMWDDCKKYIIDNSSEESFNSLIGILNVFLQEHKEAEYKERNN